MTRFDLRSLIVLFFSLIALVSAAADQLRFESRDKRTALIELYTSEGCSSCPPAEAWLSKLKTNPGLWKDFVPLAFHVDYWDRLGWRDRFAASEWTQRQYTYVSLLRDDSVYTPEFIVNGNEWRDWFRNGYLPKEDSRGGILSATTTDGKNLRFRTEDKTNPVWKCMLHFWVVELIPKLAGVKIMDGNCSTISSFSNIAQCR